MKIEEKYACLILESEDETLFANHPFQMVTQKDMEIKKYRGTLGHP